MTSPSPANEVDPGGLPPGSTQPRRSDEPSDIADATSNGGPNSVVPHATAYRVWRLNLMNHWDAQEGEDGKYAPVVVGALAP